MSHAFSGQMALTPQPANLTPLGANVVAIGDPETERRIVILEAALRILRDVPRLGDSWQRAEWLRTLEQDRAALRGLGRWPA
jgi:hypothetical protein